MTTASVVRYRDFLTMVEQVRDNDPALMHRILEPDGYLQTRRTTAYEVTRAVVELNAAAFRHRCADDAPTIIFSWGKCRTGSTALTNLFGIAGIPAYYNPIKTAVRHFVLESKGDPWNVPARTEQPFIFAKNMSGPYHLADCLVNSLQILVEAGYPTNRIELLVLDRDPFQALDSWLNIWCRMIAPERLVQHYVLSALNAIRMKTYAATCGIRVSHFVYEASRIPEKTVHSMFRRFGIERLFQGTVIGHWNEAGALESRNSKIIYPRLPKVIEHIPGMHSSETSYHYRTRGTDRVSSAHQALIEATGVIEVYREAALGCARELGFTMEDCAKVFRATPLERDIGPGAPPHRNLTSRQTS